MESVGFDVQDIGFQMKVSALAFKVKKPAKGPHHLAQRLLDPHRGNPNHSPANPNASPKKLIVVPPEPLKYENYVPFGPVIKAFAL